MSPTGADIVLDVPAERDLPPARREAIRQLLEEVVDESRRTPEPKRPRRLWQGVALAATTAVVAAVMIVANVATMRDGIVHAATPPVLDGELAQGEQAAAPLRSLADTAAEAPQPAREAQISTENWWLTVSVDGEGAAEQVTTAIVPVLRSQTFRADGTVRVREVRGEPQFPNEQYRRAWDEQGNPDPTGTVLLDRTVPAERLPSSFPQELAGDVGGLRTQLLPSEQTRDPEDSAAALFRAVGDMHSERLVDARTRIAALRMLAREPAVVSLGGMTDRAGRDAVAVATDSTDTGLPRRHVLFLDPADGSVLAYEEILTGDTGRLGVDSPAVVSYTLFR